MVLKTLRISPSETVPQKNSYYYYLYNHFISSETQEWRRYGDRSRAEMRRWTCSCTEPVGRRPTGRWSGACVQRPLLVAVRPVMGQAAREVGSSPCRSSSNVPPLPARRARLSESQTLRPAQKDNVAASVLSAFKNTITQTETKHIYAPMAFPATHDYAQAYLLVAL